MRRPLLTLKGKTALLFSGLGLLLAITGILVALDLHAIRVDARRLAEETRESVLASELRSLIHDIEAGFGPDPSAVAQDAARTQAVQRSLSTFRKRLGQFMRGAAGEDPSRGQHQSAEARIVARILDDVAGIEAALGSHQRGNDRLAGEIDHAKRYAEVLSQETRSEAGVDTADLDLRAEGAGWLLWISFLFVVLGFVWISLYFIRDVASPILELRDGAKRLGRGEFEFRIDLPRRDEIGQLAASFNEMAERLGTERGALEESLARRTRDFIRAARFADLGVLAAGLAHEINNPLASIASSAEGLERRLARAELDPAEAGEYLRTIAAEAYRVSGITERLLALSRPTQKQLGLVDLKLVLSHVDLMFRHQIEDRGLTLRTDCSEASLWIHGNAESLVQVFSNLLRNAMDASPPGGEIMIHCARAPDGPCIEIRDQGPGIPEREREKVFAPFYTTKEPGKGTGLGLALVSSLLESMGARIEVKQRPEGGGCLAVYPAREQGTTG